MSRLRRMPLPTPSPVSAARRRLLGSLALAPASAGWWAAPAAAAAPSARRFGDTLGLGVKFAQGQSASELPMLTELRVRWVRDVIVWPDLEPTAGRHVAFAAPLRERLAFYARHDIGVVMLLTLGNDKAYPPVPDEQPPRRYDPEAFGRYAAAVARQLRALGVRFVLEIGNEPHNSQFAKTLGGHWTGRGPANWVKHYVRMVAAAVREVKAIDPAIRLLSDDDMWIVHYWYLEAGLPRELDGFAVHPYVKGAPEKAAVGFQTDWLAPFTVVDRDASFRSAVRRLREQGEAKLGRRPEIWITEWGWPVGPGAAGPAIDDATLVAYLPRAFILSAAAGVEALLWFSSRDSVDGPMGLTRNDGSRRDSYRAFKTMAAELADSTLLRQVAGAAQPTEGLQAFLFESEAGRKLAVWSADGRPRRLKLPPGGAPVRGVDALGQALPAEGASLSVGAAPIYLAGGWSDAVLAARLDTDD